MMVTTNFDVCIEKALGLKDSEMNVKDVRGIKAIEYAKGQYVYHIHGIVTDEHIETNLGATLTNVSKSLSKQFTNMLCKCFEDGYTIIFIGYGGVDFFDIKPFFDSLKWFYSDWADRLALIYNDWKDDDPESIALEIAIVYYLCGPHTKRLFRNWIIKIPHRHKIETQLRELLAYIDQLLQYPYNHFLYMTFYIGPNRRKHIINAILDKGTKKKNTGLIYSSFGDIYSSKTKIYGDIQTEWDICMETPNLFDAGKIIQGIMEQYICKIARGKPANPLSLYKLFKIQHKIIEIRKD